MSESSTGRATHASVKKSAGWAVLGQVFTNVVRFASNLALTRIFVDDKTAFGLQALVAGVMQLMQLFTDIGAWVSVVRHERGAEPGFLHTAWTVQLIRGVLLCAAGLILAPYFADFYEDPALTFLIRLASFGFLIDALGSARSMLLRRAAVLRPLILIDCASALVGSGTTVWVAWLMHDAVAMVVGGLASGLTRLLLVRMLPGPRDRLAWDRTALHELLRVGAWVFINTMLMFLSTQDRLVFGTLVSKDELGVYFVAWTIASVPATVFGGLAHGLLLPLVSAYVAGGGGAAKSVLGARAVLLALGGWCLAGLSAGGPLIAHFLYPSTYAELGDLIPLATLSLYLAGVLEQSRTAVFAALDRYPWTSAGSLTKLAALLITVPIGHAQAGFHGAIVGYAIADVPRLLVVTFLGRKTGVAGFWQDVWFVGWFFLSTWVGIEARQLVEAAGWHYGFGMAAVFVSVTAVWILVAGRHVRAFWRQK
ncbi:MAG: hypothetical protein RL398_1172 [Planctomycetota bacterium]